MLMFTVFNYEENTAVLIFEDGRTYTLRSSKDTHIQRFYDWFYSEKYYPLLNDERWERTMEDTQPIIDLKEVA